MMEYWNSGIMGIKFGKYLIVKLKIEIQSDYPILPIFHHSSIPFAGQV